MLALPQDVEVALRQLLSVVRSEPYQQFAFGGAAYKDDASVVNKISGLLYATWYCAETEKQTAEVKLGRDDLVAALRASVASSTRYQQMWVVMRSEHNGTCLAGYQNQTREFRPG